MADHGPVPPTSPPEPSAPKPPLSATGTKPSVVVWGRAQLRVGQLEDGICEMEKMAVAKRPAQVGRLRVLTGRLLARRWRGWQQEVAMAPVEDPGVWRMQLLEQGRRR